MAYITQQEVSKLLGRSLTTAETNAFSEWESIAESRLADLLCVKDLSELLTILGVQILPTELKLVLARFFGGISVENGVEIGVTSKKVEDFSITYDDSERKNIFGNLVTANGGTILKYTQCKTVRSGRTLNEERKYYHYDLF